MNKHKKSFKLTSKDITASFDYTDQGYQVSSAMQTGTLANISEFAEIASETIEGLTGVQTPVPSLVEEIVQKLKGQ